LNLKDLVYVSESPIHGRGAFATRPIKKGTFIGEYEGPEARRNGKYVLWCYEDGEATGRRGLNRLRYLNHADRPNAEFDGFELYARRNIRKGEEITIDYDPL